MTLEVKRAPKAAKKPKQSRKLVLAETHVVAVHLTRKDESGNLFESVIDFGKGTVQVRQATYPTTLDAEGVGNVIEYFEGILDTLVNAPDPVVPDEEEAEQA